MYVCVYMRIHLYICRCMAVYTYMWLSNCAENILKGCIHTCRHRDMHTYNDTYLYIYTHMHI